MIYIQLARLLTCISTLCRKATALRLEYENYVKQVIGLKIIENSCQTPALFLENSKLKRIPMQMCASILTL